MSDHRFLCEQVPKRGVKQSQWSEDLLMAEDGEPQGSLFLIQAQEEHATYPSAHFLQIISPLSPLLPGCLSPFHSYA